MIITGRTCRLGLSLLRAAPSASDRDPHGPNLMRLRRGCYRASAAHPQTAILTGRTWGRPRQLLREDTACALDGSSDCDHNGPNLIFRAGTHRFNLHEFLLSPSCVIFHRVLSFRYGARPSLCAGSSLWNDLMVAFWPFFWQLNQRPAEGSGRPAEDQWGFVPPQASSESVDNWPLAIFTIRQSGVIRCL